MSAALSYRPPSTIEAPRKPGLRSTCPRRYDAAMRARDLLRALVARRRISERELSECWGVSPRVARQKLTGEAPLHVGEVLLLPHRIALEVLDDVRVHLLTAAHG